jgi:hypothetical protein
MSRRGIHPRLLQLSLTMDDWGPRWNASRECFRRRMDRKASR